MKALTLWQPWATLVALGEKKIETRCWETKHRGLLAIHSAAKLPPKWLGASRHDPFFRDELADILHARRDCDDRLGRHVDDAIRELPYGSILCVVNLVSIEPTIAVRHFVDARERVFGNYEDGRFAWHLEMVARLPTPAPAKGNRLLWNWDMRDALPPLELLRPHHEEEANRQKADCRHL